MSAAARARGGEVGRSIASSSRSQSRAGVVPNTLPAPLITAGIPAASSASRISAALRCLRTSTATCPGWTGSRASVAPAASRRSICAPEERSSTRSAATSSAICSRAEAFDGKPRAVRVTPGWSRCRTRTRSGAATGAPDRRGARFASAARTSRYSIPSCPSRAPPNSAS